MFLVEHQPHINLKYVQQARHNQLMCGGDGEYLQIDLTSHLFREESSSNKCADLIWTCLPEV